VRASAARYILDAGPIVGALSERDQWYDWSRKTLGLVDTFAMTTELVFGEACHHLKAFRPGLYAALEGVHAGRFILESVWKENVPRALELLARYPQMDASDCSLVLLSERFPRARIITTDIAHFRIYRRFRNEALPLLAPA
jgi:predicted nucleic acid-binding protein